MKCSKEIAEKVSELQKSEKICKALYQDIEAYFTKELGAHGFEVPFITDSPYGRLSNKDEYHHEFKYDDGCEGTHFHQIEGSTQYVGYSFGIGY